MMIAKDISAIDVLSISYNNSFTVQILNMMNNWSSVPISSNHSQDGCVEKNDRWII